MPALLTDLAAWRQLTPPVRVGPAAAGTITIDDLSNHQGYQRVTAARISGSGLTRRSILLSPLHLANWVIIELLARPCFYDRAWITPGPGQLGFLPDAAGDTPQLWLAPNLSATERPDPSTAGTAIGALLAPVADVAARCSRIHQRAVTSIAAESAIAGLFRTVRSVGHQADRDWLEAASAALALALGAWVTTDRLHGRPDAGPDVVAPARTLCCVLNAKVSCHACPACPKTGDRAEQERRFTKWLAAMDDEEFFETTGRAKIFRGGSSAARRGLHPLRRRGSRPTARIAARAIVVG